MLIEHDFGCGMETMEDCDTEAPTFPMHKKQKQDPSKQNLKSDNCCDNQFTELKVKDGFDTNNNEVQFNIDFLFAFVSVISNPDFNNHVSPVTYYDISPPLPTIDIIVRVQSFLV